MSVASKEAARFGQMYNKRNNVDVRYHHSKGSIHTFEGKKARKEVISVKCEVHPPRIRQKGHNNLKTIKTRKKREGSIVNGYFENISRREREAIKGGTICAERWNDDQHHNTYGTLGTVTARLKYCLQLNNLTYTSRMSRNRSMIRMHRLR